VLHFVMEHVEEEEEEEEKGGGTDNGIWLSEVIFFGLRP
jgi:hypothetical protein